MQSAVEYCISGDHDRKQQQPPYSAARAYVSRTEYDEYCYADYVLQNNMPRGLFRLRSAECERREWHYRFYYKNKRLVKVQRCNSRNMPYPAKIPWQAERPMLLEIGYDAQGKPAYHIYRNESESKSLKIAFRDDRFAELQSIDGKYIRSYYHLFRDSYSSSNATFYNAVSSFAIKRDDKGYIRELRFYNAERKPTPNEYGAWGLRYERDERGRILSFCYISKDGEPVEDEIGVASREFRYGESRKDVAFIVRVSWRNQKGELVCGRTSWASMELEWSHQGNLVRQLFYDTKHARCLNDKGVSRVDWTYNEHGHPIRRSYADVEEKICGDHEGNFITEWGYNESGECTEQRSYDVHAYPCKNKQGCHKLSWSTSKLKGNRVVDTTFFDEEDAACENENGYSRRRITYDKQGNASNYAVYDLKGNLCLDEDEYAELRFERDAAGNIRELRMFDASGNPCKCTDEFSIIKMDYDSRGNLIEEAFYDEFGQSCASRKGYAKSRRSLDVHGRCTQIVFTDGNNQPVADKNGISKTTWEYDERGRQVHVKSYDLQGQLIPDDEDDNTASQTSCSDE